MAAHLLVVTDRSFEDGGNSSVQKVWPDLSVCLSVTTNRKKFCRLATPFHHETNMQHLQFLLIKREILLLIIITNFIILSSEVLDVAPFP